MNPISYVLDGETVTITGISVDNKGNELDQVYISYITSGGIGKVKRDVWGIVGGLVPDTITL